MTSSAIYMLIHSMYELNGVFPSVDEICKKTNCAKDAVESVLDYFVKTNKLNYSNGVYSFPNKDKQKKVMFTICRVIMGIVGICCILCSIRFTYSFNKLTMPKLWGFILSASLIIFTSFCFTIREYLLQQGKNKQATLFILLYVMGIFYSIFTAVAGQYNDYLIQNKTTVEAKLNNAINENKLQLLQQQKTSYENQIKNYEKQITAQQNIIDNLSQSPEKKWEYNNTWKNAVALVNDCNSKIEQLQNKVAVIDEQIINSITIETNESKNIYDWIAELFHIPASLIQFLISLFPAIFIDLVSPFAISFAFLEKIK